MSLQDDDLNACAALVERGDPDRFAATMAVPVAARRVLFPLFAMNLEVARAPWVTQEPLIAEMRLQWWRDALEEIASGGLVRRHEVVTPLAHVLDDESARLLDRLVVARLRDARGEGFAALAEFETYLEETAGVLMCAAVRLLDGGAEPAAMDLGYASGLASYLRAVPDLRARGRRPLVQDDLAAISQLAGSGLARWRSGRAGIVGPASLSAWQAGGILRRAQAEPRRVLDGRLASSEARRRWGLLWASMRARV